MPVFSVNMRHTPESCPLFNAELKAKFKALIVKRAEASEKHEVKVISAWTSLLDHLIFYVVEASSQKALEDYFIEVGFAFWNTVEIRQVKLVEDILKGIEKASTS